MQAVNDETNDTFKKKTKLNFLQLFAYVQE